MSLQPILESDAIRIKNNLIKASTIDINLLSEAGYHFIHLASGFIAHYDRGGFIAEYGTANNLADDILRYQPDNQWHNFSSSHKDYEYMMQKKEIYNEVCKGIKEFRNSNLFGKDIYKDKRYIITITIAGTGKDPASAFANTSIGRMFNIPEEQLSFIEVK
jgi:hypothetical protein